jgi:hypothetical protein
MPKTEEATIDSIDASNTLGELSVQDSTEDVHGETVLESEQDELQEENDSQADGFGEESEDDNQETEDGQEESLLDVSFGEEEPTDELSLTEFSEVEKLLKEGSTSAAIERLKAHEQGLTKLKADAEETRNALSYLDQTFAKIANGDVDAAIEIEDKLEQAYGVRVTINPPDVDEKPKVQRDTRAETALAKIQELEDRLKARDWAASDQANKIFTAVKNRHNVELNLEDVWKAKQYLPKGRQASTEDILEAVAKVNPAKIVRELLKSQQRPSTPDSVKLPTNRKASTTDLTKLLDDPRAFAKMFGYRG